MIAAAYLRISVATEDSTSIAAQKQITENWANAHGHQITFYEDSGISGSKDIERPAFNRLKNDIAAGAVDIVVVKSVDRLARSLKKFVDFADNCREHDTTIHVVESGIDTSTATGTLMLNLLSTFAAFEGEQIAQRQKVSQAHRRKEGRATNHPPLGFVNVKRDGGTYRQIDPQTSPFVSRIANSIISGSSFRALSKELNKEGLLPRSGKQWAPFTVRTLAVNPSIAGMRKFKDDVVRDENNLPIIDSHLQIISLEDWYELQEKIAGRASHRPQGMGNEQLLLRGLMVCDGCNKRMVRDGTNGRDRYGCSGRNLSTCPSPAVISATKIENFVTAQIQPMLDLPAITLTVESDPVAVQSRLLISAEMENLAGTMTSLPPEDMVEAAERLGQLKNQRDAIDVGEVVTRTNTGETLREWWEQDQKRVIFHAIEQINVSPGRDIHNRVTIHWRDSLQDFDD